jgi:hypothetical protein
MTLNPESAALHPGSDKLLKTDSVNAGSHVPELLSSNDTWRKATERLKGPVVACGIDNGTTYRCPIDMGQPPAGNGDVKDAATLGKDWDAAYKKKDFTQTNADIASAARDAYSASGMSGVKQLEKDVNAAAVTKGFGIALVPDGDGKMKILNGSFVQDKRQLAGYAAEMGLGKEKELNAQGIYRVGFGFFKTIPDSTESFNLK